MTEAESIDRTAARLRRLARWLVVATTIAVSGLALGGVSLAVRASDQDAQNARRDWDTAAAANHDCLVRVEARDGTIETGHADFDREEAGIARDVAQNELVGRILGLSPNQDSPVLQEALALVAESRQLIESDRKQLAADRVEFDQTRPPIDPATCPPAPAGPRP